MTTQISSLVSKLLRPEQPLEVILDLAYELLSLELMDDVDFEVNYDDDLDLFSIYEGSLMYYYTYEELIEEVILSCQEV